MSLKDQSDSRPISPHIQIYKPQITSFTSILHRITGIFLFVGILAICWWIVYYTYQVEIFSDDISEENCDCIILNSLKYLIYFIIFAWVFSLYYHLCNGIRHLFWDIGKGFDKNIANRNGIIVLAIAFLMTITSIYCAFIIF